MSEYKVGDTVLYQLRGEYRIGKVVKLDGKCITILPLDKKVEVGVDLATPEDPEGKNRAFTGQSQV